MNRIDEMKKLRLMSLPSSIIKQLIQLIGISVEYKNEDEMKANTKESIIDFCFLRNHSIRKWISLLILNTKSVGCCASYAFGLIKIY